MKNFKCYEYHLIINSNLTGLGNLSSKGITKVPWKYGIMESRSSNQGHIIQPIIFDLLLSKKNSEFINGSNV